MATEVLNNFDDFVLYSNLQNTYSSNSFDNIYEDMAANYQQDFSSLYDPYHHEPGMTTGDMRFYNESRAQAKPGVSASPSVSISHSIDHVPSNFSNTSAASGQSTASSAAGSPYSQHQSLPAGQDQWYELGLGINGSLAPSEVFPDAYHLAPTESTGNYGDKFSSSYVDPTLLSSFDRPGTIGAPASPYPATMPYSYPTPSQMVQPPSPVPSDMSSGHDSHRNSLLSRSRHASPYLYNPYPPPQNRMGRRGSISSHYSRVSHDSPRSNSLGFDEDGRERGRCPHPECGRLFKDLKAHMLTHQSERPEKCPIVTCEYHTKGFARKYDRCRHTLTHYKGTMVCDFCPNSGSAAEKSFNRADVFKRHLTSVHGVEQSPPNSRKKTPSSAKKSTKIEDRVGKCSTCSSTFSNAQEFYDHLDECVLKFLDKGEPSEKVNEQRLKEVNEDPEVKDTLERMGLPTELESQTHSEEAYGDDDEDAEADAEGDNDVDEAWAGPGSDPRSGKGGLKTGKKDSS